MIEPRHCAALRGRIEAGEPDTGFVFEPDKVEHLASCDLCRRLVADADPTALFALLSLERKEESFWTGFETRVLAVVREEALERPRGALAALAGALLRPRSLALVAGSLLLALVALRVEIPPTPRIVRQPVPIVLGPSVRLERDAAEPAPVESAGSATARIIMFKVGEPGHEQSDVVMIFDPEMDI